MKTLNVARAPLFASAALMVAVICNCMEGGGDLYGRAVNAMQAVPDVLVLRV